MDLSGLEHYTDPDDRNLVIYHSRNIDIDTRTAAIIKDADILLERCQDKYSHVKEHQLLLRCLDEQTAIVMEGAGFASKGKNHRNRHLFKTRQTQRLPSVPRLERSTSAMWRIS